MTDYPEIPSSGVTSLRVSGLEEELKTLYAAYPGGRSYNSAIRKAIENEAARLRMLRDREYYGSLPAIKELQDDLSNTQARHRMRRAGWSLHRIVKFGETEYILMEQVWLRPGRMTVDVINVTEFDAHGEFYVFRLKKQPWAEQEWAYLLHGDEGISLLTVYNEKLHEYTNPFTAVLTVQVVPPTSEMMQETADVLDHELQEYGPRPDL